MRARVWSTHVMPVLVGMLLVMLLVSSSMAAEHFDFDGETIIVNIPSWWAGITPVGVPGQFSFMNITPRLQAHLDEVEARFNVKIEFDFLTNPVQKLITDAIAGDKTFDFVFLGEQYLATLANEGLLHNLDNVLDDDFYTRIPSVISMRNSPNSFRVNGITYAFPVLAVPPEIYGVIWDMDFFEQEGLPNLYELYDAGEWTWDALEDIAAMAVRDTTGDGVIDRYGLNFHMARRQKQKYRLFASANDATYTRMVDGYMTLTIDEAEHLDALEFLHRLQSQGLTGDVWEPAAMSVGALHHMSSPGHPSYQLWSESAHGIVPIPMGPAASEYSSNMWNHWVGGIPVTVEDPRAVVEVIMALFEVAAPYIDDLDVWEQEFWEYWSTGLHDRRSLEIWQTMIATAYMEPSPLPFLSLVQVGWTPQVNRILEGENPATVLGEIKPAAQALLDEYLGQ